MNLSQILDQLQDIDAGGKGSGDHGHSGRPGQRGGSGHGPGMYDPEQVKNIYQDLKQRVMDKERRALNKKLKEDPAQYHTGGKISEKVKRDLKDRGVLIPINKATPVYKETTGRTEEQLKRKVKGYRKETAEEAARRDLQEGGFHQRLSNIPILKEIAENHPVPMGKNEGRESSVNVRAHSMTGKFEEETYKYLPNEKRGIYLYSALDKNTGKVAAIFIHKMDITPTKSRVVIEEIKATTKTLYENKKGELSKGHPEIVDAKKYQFNSSNKAKTFLNNRYGIYGIRWRKHAGDVKASVGSLIRDLLRLVPKHSIPTSRLRINPAGYQRWLSQRVTAGGPGSGRRPMFQVGDRVRRNPKIWKGKRGEGPENFGTVVKVSEGKDDKGRQTTVYRVHDDAQEKHNRDFAKHPEKYDPIWDKPKTDGYPYTEKELVPHNKSFKASIHFGGKGSGDYGHSGRPGEKGGSGKGGFTSDHLHEVMKRMKPDYHKVSQIRRALAKHGHVVDRETIRQKLKKLIDQGHVTKMTTGFDKPGSRYSLTEHQKVDSGKKGDFMKSIVEHEDHKSEQTKEVEEGLKRFKYLQDKANDKGLSYKQLSEKQKLYNWLEHRGAVGPEDLEHKSGTHVSKENKPGQTPSHEETPRQKLNRINREAKEAMERENDTVAKSHSKSQRNLDRYYKSVRKSKRPRNI